MNYKEEYVLANEQLLYQLYKNRNMLQSKLKDSQEKVRQLSDYIKSMEGK